jgi:DNA invertase Pin-like site-specific DNA recombinase
MADTSLAQTLQSAAITLALRAAREEVKQAIRAEGRRKLQTIPHREIRLAAREYLAGHPELVAEARLTARQWAAEGVFGKRVAAQAKALIAELKPCDARASAERNSCTEWSCEVIKGYARVSTDGQDLATQYELLKAAGAELVYSEKQSVIKTDRAALARCIASLEPGDTVVVTKLDRLARSTRDLLNILATVGEAGANFRSLGDPWADTTPHGRVMLTVLGGLAEFERHLILSRTNEGRVRAKARGVRFGRKPKLTKHQQTEALARLARGETLTAIARAITSVI